MSKHLNAFKGGDGTVTAVSLPVSPRALIEDWASLRASMIKTTPESFTRDEWAYLIGFLSPENLWRPFRESFGEALTGEGGLRTANALYRPRGQVGLWLPNNVSLLGPLTMILLSLTGQRMQVKVGSHSADLTSAFVEFVLAKLKPGPLATLLKTELHCATFPRTDERNARMAAECRVRIVFGGDEAAEAIDRLPHPAGSVGYYFVDKRSEAWLEAGALSDEVLTTLIKVFTIYGRAGCTSPRRVVVFGAGEKELKTLRERLFALWPKAWPRTPPMHIASENIMARQWAAAAGWDAAMAPHHAATVCLGDGSAPEIDSLMFLPLVPGERESVTRHLPAN
ncbi:MAG TPA: acyl-CoA reductase, partial [Gammaproteobacteria bacterium]|nr:acyl-CoA reductase [Gammaproteobacteria bacterium]